jgi:hypothetical protein
VNAIIAKGVQELRKNGVELPRDDWIREAEKCEENGSVATCQAIIKATIAQDVDEEARLDTWMEDAESSLARGRVETARAVYAYALRVMPQKPILWRRAADLEKAHGSRLVPFFYFPLAVDLMMLISGRTYSPCSNKPSHTVRIPRFSGSWPPRRAGRQATYPLLARSWATHSLPTRRASRFGSLRASWRLRTISWRLRDS